MEMFSPFPSEPFEPALGDEIESKAFRNEIGFKREDYPALPWPLDEYLIGSLWCNIHTGTRLQVSRIVAGPSWKGDAPLPCFSRSHIAWDSLNSPGFWVCQRFIIEHWVRVDLWPFPWQLRWFGVELSFRRREIARAEQSIRDLGPKHPGDTTWSANRNMYQREMEHHQQELALVTERIHRFAQEHDLAIPLELLNEGIGQSTQPEQLSLF